MDGHHRGHHSKQPLAMVCLQQSSIEYVYNKLPIFMHIQTMNSMNIVL